MQPDPPFNALLAWRYQILAEEALTYARVVNDPDKKRVFEKLADDYLRRADGDPAEEARPVAT